MALHIRQLHRVLKKIRLPMKRHFRLAYLPYSLIVTLQHARVINYVIA
jgi:2-polyprenyl-3-methyl-5-hydroxy-6-metoxy-1,4-benzoquinol methylase